ncbi:MAG: hypothetical protein LBT09_07140 [Planctomycetaceae bacterium]|nr:hypothetical protein [Planctomycetaceae bacterium]
MRLYIYGLPVFEALVFPCARLWSSRARGSGLPVLELLSAFFANKFQAKSFVGDPLCRTYISRNFYLNNDQPARPFGKRIAYLIWLRRIFDSAFRNFHYQT